MTDIPSNATTTAVFEGDPTALATFSGELETFDDKNWIRITLTAGNTHLFFGSATSAGAEGDSEMTLFNAAGFQLATNDDHLGGLTLNSAFLYTAVTSGTYFLEMKAHIGDPGSYSVAVTYNQGFSRLSATADNFSGLVGGLIVGDKGDDTINLGGSAINALGEQGEDTITGHAGNNFISGGLGNDTIDGSAGSDRLFGDAGDDVIHGREGFDEIHGGDGADRLFGEAEADTISGGSGSDFINGGDGGDTLDGGPGADRMFGGDGNDTIHVDNAADQVFESVLNGLDTVFTTVSFALAAGQAIEFLRAIAPSSTPINLTGNEFANTLTGNNGANILNGAAGADVLQGLLGNDTYVLGAEATGVDTVTDTGGIDTITSTINRSLASYPAIERLTLTGTAVNGIGNALANVLTGSASANNLNGLSGNDTLRGGFGNDNLTGGANLDIFVFDTALSAVSNRDVVFDFSHVDDTFQLENAVFTKLGAGVHVLNPLFFKAGAATDANDYIVYNQATGLLSYDVNGNGAGGAIAFAVLANKPVLTASDFVVI